MFPPAPFPLSNPVTVVAVVRQDEQQAWWQFSSPVVSFDDVSGLQINGQAPAVGLTISPEGWLLIGYDNDFAPGDPWNASEPFTLVFEDGGVLEVPESGVIS